MTVNTNAATGEDHNVHPIDFLLLSTSIGYLFWHIGWARDWLYPPPEEKSTAPPPVHKAKVYRLDEYQRRIDRRGRPELVHVSRRIKR